MLDLRIVCGTPGYIDPSVLNGEIFTKVSDIFSLGSLLFNMLTGRSLFAGKDQEEILYNNNNFQTN